jgi:hypothetical protein
VHHQPASAPPRGAARQEPVQSTTTAASTGARVHRHHAAHSKRVATVHSTSRHQVGEGARAWTVPGPLRSPKPEARRISGPAKRAWRDASAQSPNASRWARSRRMFWRRE